MPSRCSARDTPTRPPLAEIGNIPENSPGQASQLSAALREMGNPMSPHSPKSLEVDLETIAESESALSIVPGASAHEGAATEDGCTAVTPEATPEATGQGSSGPAVEVAIKAAQNATTEPATEAAPVPPVAQQAVSNSRPFGETDKTIYAGNCVTQDGTPIVVVGNDEGRYKMTLDGPVIHPFGLDKYYPGNPEADVTARETALARSYTIRPGLRMTNGIGPYNFGELFGQGGSGSVHVAKHAVTGEIVAVKVLKKSILLFDGNSLFQKPNGRHEGFIGQTKMKIPWLFYREIAILKLAHIHPNIIKLKDIWEDSTKLGVVMEHVNGGDLFAYLGHRGRIPEPELIGYFRQIISGIEFIHSFDICHRDLKLENIVMDGHGRVYIADFGLAIRCNGVVLGDHCGSAHYSPPEVVKGFGTYDGIKADIWSLGCVLYALGSGYLPFDYETDKEVKVYIVTVTYRMPDFSEELKHLIWNILQFEPKDRLTIDEIWRHPAITRYPTKDKHGIECDRFQMPFTRVDLLGPVVDDPQKLNQDSVEALSVMWQRSPRKIRFFLLHDRPSKVKRAYLLLEKYREWQIRFHDASPKLQAKRRANALKKLRAVKASTSRKLVRAKTEARLTPRMMLARRARVRYISGRQDLIANYSPSISPSVSTSGSFSSSIVSFDDEEVTWEDIPDDYLDIGENPPDFTARVNARGSVGFSANVGRADSKDIPSPPYTGQGVDSEEIFYRPYKTNATDTRPEDWLDPLTYPEMNIRQAKWKPIPIEGYARPSMAEAPETAPKELIPTTDKMGKRKKSFIDHLNDFRQKFNLKDIKDNEVFVDKPEEPKTARGKQVLKKLKGALGRKGNLDSKPGNLTVGQVAMLAASAPLAMATPAEMPALGQQAQPSKSADTKPKVARKSCNTRAGLLRDFIANSGNMRILTSNADAFTIRKMIIKTWKGWLSSGWLITLMDEEHGFLRGRVMKKNSYGLKEVTICCLIRPRDGSHRDGNSVVRFTREKGSSKSFRIVIDEMQKAFAETEYFFEEAKKSRRLSRVYFK